MSFYNARRQQADEVNLSVLARNSTAKRLYMLTYRNGTPLLWCDAYTERKAAMRNATRNCLSSDEYERLGNTSARWRVLYRRGYRIRKFAAVPV